ncbi:hypothetical protein CAEBREN_32248 [Caenorhabditis brenneri]|uniref:Uncharacterized protein n=1 Tax=Caenorhabditis brenneri TaxID=135651 RepID=G0MKX9_CAEBE|nr:hypothetical protein CAEBREN_32248 [Caenorhabditis brenneri]
MRYKLEGLQQPIINPTFDHKVFDVYIVLLRTMQ